MKPFVYILFLFIPFFCYSQKQGNIWYFGDHAGIDFSSGIPVAITDGATYTPPFDPSDGTAVICDSSGSLLFYTNGQQIWNRNHIIMPNGDSILGHWSSTQSALIVPEPGSSKLFYVFTTDAFYEDDLKYGFRYSIVDICLDNGLGDVVKEYKNIKLLDTTCEKLTAIKHANGIDYWIIVHKYYSDAFYSYHFTSTGITDTVISHIGSRHPLNSLPINTAYSLGQLKASPNGQKLCIVSGNGYGIAEIFDFDKTTGLINNCVNIQTDSIYCYYGTSFSPDNSKLYIACWLNNNGIYQFDLDAGNGNPDSIIASKTCIISSTHYSMQLANNGKIYTTQMANGNQYLGVIENPNVSGLGCNFNDSAIYLNGKIASMGLPNFIDSYDYSNTIFNCDTTEIQEQGIQSEILLYPNPTTGEFQIESNKYFIGSVIVYNVIGVKVYEKTVNSNETTINLNVPDGVYFVQVVCEEGTVVKKIIIRK